MFNKQSILWLFLLTSSYAIADSTLIDKSGNDVTILQAWIAQNVTLGVLAPSYGQFYSLDVNHCITLERTPSSSTTSLPYVNVRVDCSEELKNVAKISYYNKISPLINNAIFEYIEVPETNSYYARTGICETVEFRTIIRNNILQNKDFTGVGFYYSSSQNYGGQTSSIITLDQLNEVGQVILKDGSPATVHRFFMQGFCFGTGGNSSSIYSRQYLFRPFSVFTSTNSSPIAIYRVCDDVSQEYVLGRKYDYSNGTSFFVSSFDRQSELLN